MLKLRIEGQGDVECLRNCPRLAVRAWCLGPWSAGHRRDGSGQSSPCGRSDKNRSGHVAYQQARRHWQNGAARDANLGRRRQRAGGLLGRPVKLVYYDDQSNPAQVPGIYSKLLDVDKVDLIVSGYASTQIAAAMP